MSAPLSRPYLLHALIVNRGSFADVHPFDHSHVLEAVRYLASCRCYPPMATDAIRPIKIAGNFFISVSRFLWFRFAFPFVSTTKENPGVCISYPVVAFFIAEIAQAQKPPFPITARLGEKLPIEEQHNRSATVRYKNYDKNVICGSI